MKKIRGDHYTVDFSRKCEGGRRRKIRLRSLLTVILCLALAFAAPVSVSAKKTTSTKTTSTTKKKKAAAKKRKKAIAAYKKLLMEGYGDDQIAKFMLLDIDKNGIPELVTRMSQNSCERSYAIFAYRNGEADRVWFTGSYPKGLYYYSSRKLICGVDEIMPGFTGGQYSGETVQYCRLPSSGEMKILAQVTKLVSGGSGEEEYQYEVGQKSVSKRNYTSYVKKITQNAKRTDLSKKLKENTAANRKKYLK